MATLRRVLRQEIQAALDRHAVLYQDTLPEELTDTVLAVIGKNKAPRQGAGKDASLHPLAAALAEVCGMDLGANRAELFREAKLLAKSPDDVRKYFAPRAAPPSWWYENDWRGKRGQRPTPHQVRQAWGGWIDASSTSPAIKVAPDGGMHL